jgi:hypothetical protein
MNRLFVCDPVCVQPFGHNVAALNYFRSAFSHRFHQAISFCCHDLPDNIKSRYGFVGAYQYYYQEFMPLLAADQPEKGGNLVIAAYFADPLERMATEDATNILEQYSVNCEDVIFFPSVDFYGVIGMLNALESVPARRRPTVMLRFIGVMESASSEYRSPEDELLKRLVFAQSHGVSLSYGAETPRLADKIASKLRQHVHLVPYPSVANACELPKEGTFNVFCPGSARIDKGFLQLLEIAAAVRQEDSALDIRFTAQNLPHSAAIHHQKYVSKLYALPGVKLLRHSISEDEMLVEYEQCTAVLLPYDSSTYRFRGSAAMMEAISVQRPVLALAGSAFAVQIAYYGLGDVCQNTTELAQAILQLATKDREDIEFEASQSRFRFLSDTEDAYTRWFGANK